MDRTLVILIALACIYLGWVGETGGTVFDTSSPPVIIPVQTPAPVPPKAEIASGQTPQQVCKADRLIIFKEGYGRDPNQIEMNQIVYGCLGATWGWTWENFKH